MVEPRLPKPMTRVRFPSPAPVALSGRPFQWLFPVAHSEAFQSFLRPCLRRRAQPLGEHAFVRHVCSTRALMSSGCAGRHQKSAPRNARRTGSHWYCASPAVVISSLRPASLAVPVPIVPSQCPLLTRVRFIVDDIWTRVHHACGRSTGFHRDVRVS